MERKDVEVILKRIKSNYNEVIIDDYTMTEWYKELKDYNFDEVMNKLESHMRSEQYGKFPPKVYFLTKYLTKEKEKVDDSKLYIRCPICNEMILNQDYDKHYGRCSSITYIINANKKYFDKEVEIEGLDKISDELFDKAYYMFCKRLYESGKTKGMEKNILIKILENCKVD